MSKVTFEIDFIPDPNYEAVMRTIESFAKLCSTMTILGTEYISIGSMMDVLMEVLKEPGSQKEKLPSITFETDLEFDSQSSPCWLTFNTIKTLAKFQSAVTADRHNYLSIPMMMDIIKSLLTESTEKKGGQQ